MTMAEQGDFIGDILISGGRIVQASEHIDTPEGAYVIDAAGMTVIPGLIDPCIRTGGAESAWIRECALHAGITTGLLLPDEGFECRLMNRNGLQSSGMRLIDSHVMDEVAFTNALEICRSDGLRPVIPVNTAKMCSRILGCNLPVGTILIDLRGCVRFSREITEAGVSVIPAVMRGSEEMLIMVAQLSFSAVPLALSCFSPDAKLSLLRLCAGLCTRHGMSPENALRAITCTPADLLGLRDRGRITAGCKADLLLLDGNPLLLSTTHLMTIAGGHIIHA